jgi:hypothetical protein
MGQRQLGDAVAVERGERPDADGYGRRRRRSARLRVDDERAKPFTEHGRGRISGVRCQHGKLVAADAGPDIRFAQAAANRAATRCST